MRKYKSTFFPAYVVIDREGIVNAVLQGEGTVVNSSIFGPDWMGVPEDRKSVV